MKEAIMSELVGRKLGKYILEAQLGEGGMAAVYRSHHPQFNRPVAIKILPPTIGQDPSFRARFEREARTIASLNHPSIIRVYDIDESDGLFYMVMDLLPGGTIESRLREGGLDRKWSTDVIVKMAEALEYAHSRGVIHRDIKPSNILLDAEGQPVLADFGIARLVQGDGEANLTSAGMVMGTPAYMAPEHLSGGQPDARSDIYALGVVLYQLLCGRAPFTGDTMAVVTAHLTKQPQALRELVRDLPPALDAVVLQALAKQPEHRFKSAGVFAQALRSAAADLEPGLVRVASSVRASAASAGSATPAAFGATTPAVGSLQAPVAPAAPQTTGQKVARLLPIALGVIGLLLVISIVAKYWALVALLAILLGGGGFLFLYLRASSQGRKAARETTRAITTASIRAVAPPAAETHPIEDRGTAPNLLPTAEQAAVAVPPAEPDDVPEFPLPDLPTQAVAAADSGDLDATAAMPAADILPATEAVPATAAGDLLPTEALALPDQMPVLGTPADAAAPQPDAQASPPSDLAPTEAVDTANLPPVEAPASSAEQATEAVPATPAPAKSE
jgi:serine/threonine-protein kinase